MQPEIGQTKYLINNYANIRFLVGMYVNVWNRTPVWRGCLFLKLVWRALLNPPKPGSVSYIFQSDDIYSDFFFSGVRGSRCRVQRLRRHMELAPVTELTESETEDFQAMVVDFVHFFREPNSAKS